MVKHILPQVTTELEWTTLENDDHTLIKTNKKKHSYFSDVIAIKKKKKLTGLAGFSA